MTVRVYHSYEDPKAEFGITTQVTTEKNVVKIEYQDQRYIKNGIWIMLYKNNYKENCSIQIDKGDWFEVFE